MNPVLLKHRRQGMKKKQIFTKFSRIKQYIKKLGPGIITGASDDDPSGIATYSQAGAQFGLSTLWLALITFPLMTAIQEMCARIGMVTSEGLTVNIKKHYPKPLIIILVLLSFPAIILNIGADISGMGAVGNLVFPSIPSLVFSIVFTFILLLAIIFLSYRTIVMVLKYLCMALFVYLIIPFLGNQNWLLILQNTFIPTLHFDKEFMSIVVAIFGTTISPYLFFWQATMEAEDKKQHHHVFVNKHMIQDMKQDVGLGMFISNLVMYFIILTTGTILFNAGVHQIDTVEQAAKALEPLAGRLSYLLFAMGIIGTGFLSIPVLSGCLSYILSAIFDWKGGLDKSFYQAKSFYLVIIISLFLGLAITFIGLSPIKALLYTAILYGLTAPALILIILHISNNKNIMGKNTNGLVSNLLGILTFLIMFIAAIILIYFQVSSWIGT
jgi:NRAMP (natural resistance-associated macrophage protein)-like metal ion transporter